MTVSGGVEIGENDQKFEEARRTYRLNYGYDIE